MNILETIVAQKRREIEMLPDITGARCQQNFSGLFYPAPALFAEIKAASPSEGDIVETLDAVAVARAYTEGGANAISVLTDASFFKGSFDILKAVRAATDKLLLCKEFILHKKQIHMARACGADLCLLIVKILSAVELAELKAEIESLGMRAVIEVQNKTELAAALAVNPEIILVNNRDLTSFAVDMNTTHDVLEGLPPGVRIIAASGLKTPGDIKQFSSRVDGFLIGTALMRTADKVAFLKRCRDV